MDLGLRGKVAMVAASSKGIGLACAKELAAEGCRVAICGRSTENLDVALAELGEGSKGYVCDVSRAADLERWYEHTARDLGEPAILVTNTGGPPAGTFDQMSDEQWSAGVESTLMDVVRLVRLASPAMKKGGWGRIVHITSLVAKEPARLLPISSTLRAGLMALTRLEATELAPHGVTVNAVLPGHTVTDRQTHLAKVRSEREGIPVEEALKYQAQLIPLGRMANPAEVGAAVAFLCSERAAYITGVNLLVDGGITHGMG